MPCPLHAAGPLPLSDRAQHGERCCCLARQARPVGAPKTAGCRERVCSHVPVSAAAACALCPAPPLRGTASSGCRRVPRSAPCGLHACTPQACPAAAQDHQLVCEDGGEPGAEGGQGGGGWLPGPRRRALPAQHAGRQGLAAPLHAGEGGAAAACRTVPCTCVSTARPFQVAAPAPPGWRACCAGIPFPVLVLAQHARQSTLPSPFAGYAAHAGQPGPACILPNCAEYVCAWRLRTA